jgi:mannose-6-phosphate isomerase-like protein (cupin superfamily)
MNLFIDIDNTICKTPDNLSNKYELSEPIRERIEYVNKLYDEGNIITYWTARGNHSRINYEEFTKKQLQDWGCKYHHLKLNKPSFDLFIDDKCCNSDKYWNDTIYKNETEKAEKTKKTENIQKKQISEIVKKGWGHEVIFVNNDKYCGKVLHFNKGAKFSMHYHIIKKESWYVASGRFTFKYINTKNADILTEKLEPGDVITNEIGEPHQIICDEEGDIFEVSTTHYDNDSYRVFKGDSQQI